MCVLPSFEDTVTYLRKHMYQISYPHSDNFEEYVIVTAAICRAHLYESGWVGIESCVIYHGTHSVTDTRQPE